MQAIYLKRFSGENLFQERDVSPVIVLVFWLSCEPSVTVDLVTVTKSKKKGTVSEMLFQKTFERGALKTQGSCLCGLLTFLTREQK